MTDRVFIVTGGSQVGKAALIRLLQDGEVFQLGDAVMSNVRITGGGYTVSDDGQGRLLTEDGAVVGAVDYATGRFSYQMSAFARSIHRANAAMGEFGRVLTAARLSGSAQWKNEQRRFGHTRGRK